MLLAAPVREIVRGDGALGVVCAAADGGGLRVVLRVGRAADPLRVTDGSWGGGRTAALALAA
jgi:hypothetical protein